MVRWIRTGHMVMGKAMPAIAWSKEVAEYVKKYEGFSSIDVFMDTFGEVGTIRWVVDYEDFASFEKVQKQVRSDMEFNKKAESVPNLFVEGKTYDVIMSSL